VVVRAMHVETVFGHLGYSGKCKGRTRAARG
jgi:hypothetical protein